MVLAKEKEEKIRPVNRVESSRVTVKKSQPEKTGGGEAWEDLFS